ncbi:glycosyltransferase family 2 protein [Spirosoma aerolatum]|uniref:glycosyltransferase family 2 protein n=1 Tax=Spirosoma aerolatum TaxID=1211326 RepID=UPI0009ADB206|nr:glycosyltransferase family A protein [Spirosoma aerolatum]
MFSIVIPLYNKAKYIKKAIESVLDQTCQDFELIIVNDGSTDKSLEIVTHFTDPRIKIINQENLGVSIARNNGVKIACYDFIAFLDADDWWHSSFLDELAILIQDYEDATFYGTNYYYIKNGKSRIEWKGLPENFASGYIDYVSIYAKSFCVPINCSFVAVRKSAFLSVGGFCPTLRLGEDFNLWIRLALIGKVAYLNKPLAFSNQDVDGSNRAIGGVTLYQPASHFVFNLSFLSALEQQSSVLKSLLDGLRVRCLLPYYLAGKFTEEVKSILGEVDFSKQSYFYQVIYQLPVQLAHLYFRGLRMGSFLKQGILRLVR